jgi:urease accessory protein
VTSSSTTRCANEREPRDVRGPRDGQLVIEHTLREDALPAPSRGYARDTITLGWEDRLHVRGRRRSDGGVAFGLSLPRGTMLRGGDCLVLDDAKTVVVVIERPEPVFLIEPRTPQQWGLYAYHIGNRHQPLMITDAGIVCPDVAGVEQLLEQQRISYTRTTLPFTPAASTAIHHHD